MPSRESRKRPLQDRVAIVAGATRGGGRGIACALGEAGATVYCTGRSVKGNVATKGRSETIEQTAEMVSAAGGRGIAVRVDHTMEEDVILLVERVRKEQGGADLFVDSVWGGDELTQWGKPFWELSLETGRRMLENSFWSHVVTARHVAPLLFGRPGALMVQVTDGDSFAYRGNLSYDLVKTAVIRLAFAFAQELKDEGVVSLALTPGFLRSEAMLDHFGVDSGNWRDGAKKDPDFIASESPAFLGRAVAALAADPHVVRKNGRVFASWGLAKEYGFTDADGSRPDWGTHFREKYGPLQPRADEGFYAYWGA